MTRCIILPSGFEIYDGGRLIAVAARDIYAGEPWQGDMFVNYVGAPLDALPEAIVRLRTFVTTNHEEKALWVA